MSLAFAEGLARCELAAGPFPPEERRCDWCGDGLPKRRRRWCSDDCSNAFSRNHAWSSARLAARARDENRCVRCGSDGTHPARYWLRFLRAVCAEPIPLSLTAWCEEHGWYPDHIEARDLYRAYRIRVMRRWRVAMEINDDAQRRSGLEVNHIQPCLGAHRENSCLHHLDGLETLCHPCHLEETARQRRAGLLRAS